jgi:hypothetical protein
MTTRTTHGPWPGRFHAILKLIPLVGSLATGVCHAGSPFISGYEKVALARDPSTKQLTGDVVADPSGPEDTGGATVGTTLTRFFFSDRDKGIGDAGITPFGDEVEYKLNAVNYNLYLGDSLPIPFQLFIADLASNDSPGDANNSKLMDGTQGIAIQFPIAYRYKGSRFCHFADPERVNGSCLFGGDVTLRGVRLNEQDEAGVITESSVFGASASLNVAMQFPIFEGGVPGAPSTQKGHLGIGIGARYLYHNTDEQALLFGNVEDPEGTAVEFDNSFAVVSAQTEFDIYEYFKIRLEYFKPLNNRDVLDDVFKASIVIAPKSGDGT